VSSSATRETKIQLGGLGALLDSLFMVAGTEKMATEPSVAMPIWIRKSDREIYCI